MRCRARLFSGIIGALVTSTILAAGVVSPGQPPWSIKRWVRSDEARPRDSNATEDVPTSKYLHVELAVPPGTDSPDLHQFKIVDARGQVVAELYGFHAKRATLVFEGNWSRLEGLYLAGARHREPLIPGLPVRQNVELEREDRTPRKSGPPDKSWSPGETQPPTESKPAAESKQPAVAGRLPSQQLPPERATSPPSAPGERLQQEVLVTHRSRLNIQGMDFTSELQYRVLSVLNVEKCEADGSLSVLQRVEQAETMKADPLTQGVLRDLLAKLVGASFRISVGPDGSVRAFEGAAPRGHTTVGSLLGGQGIQMVSIIDPDGWREIAELTFFQPPSPAGSGRTWDRPTTHRWGPLGNWSGKVVFRPMQQRDNLMPFSYTLQLKHHPPKPSDDALPFRIVQAEFQHRQAGGTIVYDRDKGRVVQAKEDFSVQGQLILELLGQEVPVGLDESQTFDIHISEGKPVEHPHPR